MWSSNVEWYIPESEYMKRLATTTEYGQGLAHWIHPMAIVVEV